LNGGRINIRIMNFEFNIENCVIDVSSISGNMTKVLIFTIFIDINII
jgi:hypothetical protein